MVAQRRSSQSRKRSELTANCEDQYSGGEFFRDQTDWGPTLLSPKSGPTIWANQVYDLPTRQLFLFDCKVDGHYLREVIGLSLDDILWHANTHAWFRKDPSKTLGLWTHNIGQFYAKQKDRQNGV